MKTEQLTELEVFRMAVRLAEAALNNTPNALAVVNREDVLVDRIMECHSAIQSAAQQVLGNGQAGSH